MIEDLFPGKFVAKVRGNSKYRKLDPLWFSILPNGSPRLQRAKGSPGNACPIEDLTPGGLVLLDLAGGIYEVRNAG